VWLTLVAGVEEAGRDIRSFIDPHDNLGRGSEGQHIKRPLLVLAFDEAHELADFRPGNDWSIYTELRRCLCSLVDLPIFTLFLSRTGKFRLFSPERQWNRSTCIVNILRALPPITETGFDQLAFVAAEYEITLDRVVEDEWIYHLGRPLYVFPGCEL
jgi:hypothetical protein